MAGVNETARQFDATRSDETPYMDLGKAGVQHFGDLLGLNGADTQQSEIDALRASPMYQSLYGNGEQAVLANASATGGLRGGNTEHSLYSLGTDTLSQLIQQQLGQYSSAVGVGSGAAGAVGQFGAQSVAAQAALRNSGAEAQAQQKLISGGINAQNWQNVGTALSNFSNNNGSGSGQQPIGGGGSGVTPNTSDFANFDWSSVF